MLTEIFVDEHDQRFIAFKELYPEILEWKWNGIQYWHFVYLNDDPSKCIFKKGYSDHEILKSRFEQLYSFISEKTYHKLLLLTTFYTTMDDKELIDKLNTEIYLPIVFHDEELQKGSNICIAFSDQLEILYRTITGASPWEAIEFRRDINKKNQSTIRKAKQIMVNDAENLFGFLCRTCFNEAGPFFLSPNLYGSKLLYRESRKEKRIIKQLYIK